MLIEGDQKQEHALGGSGGLSTIIGCRSKSYLLSFAMFTLLRTGAPLLRNVTLLWALTAVHAYIGMGGSQTSTRRSFIAKQGLSGVAVAGFTGKAGSVVAAPSPFSIELVKRGDGPVVKDGDYAMIDFTGWLDGFQGKQVVDSSTANEGQMVKVPIGDGDTGGQGLLANQGRGGTVAKPVVVPMPLGVNKALSTGIAPRGEGGALATQASAASYKDAPTVGSRFRVIIPPDLGFGKEGGVSGLGVQIPPSSTLYYEVRIRAKTGKFQTGA